MNRPWPAASQSALAAIVAAEEELFLIETWDRPDPSRPATYEITCDREMTQAQLIRDIACGEIDGAHVSRIIAIRPNDFSSGNVTEDIARAVLKYARELAYGEALPHSVREFVHEHLSVRACE